MDRRTKKLLGAALAGIVLTIGGCTMGCRDMSLKLFGESAMATVSDPKEMETGGRRSKKEWYVDFAFTTKAGLKSRGSDKVSASWRAPEDRQVKVYYDADDPTGAALAENVGLKSFWLMGLGIVLAVLGGWGYMKQGG
jgi:hypothetical protein